MIESEPVNQEQVRAKYHDLAMEADQIIDELTVKDDHGKVVESGYNVVHSVCKRHGLVDDEVAIDIVGKERWRRLHEIWEELEQLGLQDKRLGRGETT